MLSQSLRPSFYWLLPWTCSLRSFLTPCHCSSIWDVRLTAENAVVFLHAERVQLVYNKSFADHCELQIRQLNGLLVAAHAVQFHQDQQAYTPVLPCDFPPDSIIKEAAFPTCLKRFFDVSDANGASFVNIKWGITFHVASSPSPSEGTALLPLTFSTSQKGRQTRLSHTYFAISSS